MSRRQWRRRRRLLRKVVFRAIASVVFGLLALMTIAAVVGYPARAELAAGRVMVIEGRDAVLAGDVLSGRDALSAAVDMFAAAERRLQRPVVRAATAVPFMGRSMRTAIDIAGGARLAASAAETVAAALAATPYGLRALAPENGTLPIERLVAMRPSLREANALVADAEERVATSPASWLLPAVADARADMLVELGPASDAFQTATALARALPPLFGADGQRRYLFVASNPAEVRGTGGLLGAYAMLTVDDGELSLSDFKPHQTLPPLAVDAVDMPGEDYARRYSQFGGAGLMVNINMTPDFPSAAVALENLYAESTGKRVDGVIVADPFALQGLMELTGPVRGPDGEQIRPDEIVAYLANAAFEDFEDPGERKSLLGEVASNVLERFLEGSAEVSPQNVASILGRITGRRHLQVHSTDPDVQEALIDAGLAGALPPPDGDFLAVVPNNGAANKADFYMDWKLRYEVWLEPDGNARAEVRVEARNNTPTEGRRKYVIGPYVDYLEAGDNLTHLSVFCAPGCRHTNVKQDELQTQGDRWPGVEQGVELGFTTLSTWQWVPSGGTTSVEYTLQLEDVWSGADAEDAVYELIVQTPPLARPAKAEVIIHPPHPVRIEELEGPLTVEPGEAVWSGELVAPQQFTAHMERPRESFGSRVRRYAEQIREFWSRPLL